MDDINYYINETKSICQFDTILQIVKLASFIPFGFGAFICNLIIICAIISNANLRNRREFLIIAGLAFSDFTEGFSTMLGGIYRVCIVLSGHANDQVSTLFCMLLPQSWIWRWTDTATSLMLVVISIDRLMSVALPLRYFQFTVFYAYSMIASVYTYSLVSDAFAWIHPISQRDGERISLVCMTRDFISTRYYQYSKYMTAIASALSVIIYIPMVFIMRNQLIFLSSKRVVSYNQIDRRRKSQLRVTMTLSLSSAATLLFDSIPRAIGMYGMVSEIDNGIDNCDSIYMHLFLLTKVNSMINLALYYCRHSIMRNSIRSLWPISRLLPTPSNNHDITNRIRTKAAST